MQIELKQESEAERGDREDFARAMDTARLQGRLEAFAMAMTECGKPVHRENGGMGGRDCSEIRAAIDILHLDTLRQMRLLQQNAAAVPTKVGHEQPVLPNI